MLKPPVQTHTAAPHYGSHCHQLLSLRVCFNTALSVAGHITQFPDKRFYWVGSAWVPCALKQGIDGCHLGTKPDMVYGSCGFGNNNISVCRAALALALAARPEPPPLAC